MLAPVLLAVMASAGKALAADSIPAKAEDKLIAGANCCSYIYRVLAWAHETDIPH